MKSEPKRTIEIEDLLRLKRTERPPAEFWARFDRELRAKQLAALVAKRPWWQRLPNVFTGFTRYHLPIGAAAALAITLVVVRQNHGVSLAKLTAEPQTIAATDAHSRSEISVATPVTASVETPAHSSGMQIVASAEPAAPSAATVSQTEQVSAPVAAVVTAGPMREESIAMSLAGASRVDFGAAEDAPTSFSQVASTLTVPSASEAALPRSLFVNTATGFETRGMPAKAAVDPLQQMTPPGERMRAKLLTAMVSMTSVETPARTTDRGVADRLSEERLYDQVHRFGARGAGVSMKF